VRNFWSTGWGTK